MNMALVNHEPFPAYLEQRRELGRVAIAVRNASTLVPRTLADRPRECLCAVKFGLLSGERWCGLQTYEQDTV
jgi:hypothetical protein